MPGEKKLKHDLSDSFESLDNLGRRIDFIMNSVAGPQDWIDESASGALYFTLASISDDLKKEAQSVLAIHRLAS